MKLKLKNKKKISIVRKDAPIEHRIPRSEKERKANFELFFQLQRLAYPELDKGITFQKHVVKLSRQSRS